MIGFFLFRHTPRNARNSGPLSALSKRTRGRRRLASRIGGRVVARVSPGPFGSPSFSGPNQGRAARARKAHRGATASFAWPAAEADLPSYGGPAGRSMRLGMEQLSDTCSAEKQLSRAMLRMAKKAGALSRKDGLQCTWSSPKGGSGVGGRRAQQQGPSRARCSRQSTGRPRRHARSSRAAVRSSGCSPSRMAARRSGARNASRTRRVA